MPEVKGPKYADRVIHPENSREEHVQDRRKRSGGRGGGRRRTCMCPGERRGER